MMQKEIIHTLGLLVGAVCLFYFGYNTLFKTKDFLAKLERVYGRTPQWYRKQLKKGGYYLEYKIVAVAALIMSVISFVIFIIQLISLLKGGTTIFHVK
jgi:hypothetical protein